MEMDHSLHLSSPKIRLFASRLGSLILFFQRSPLVQMLFPEGKVLGGVALSNASQWTIAAVAGLGAYDTVAGATTVSQLAPRAGADSVTAPLGVPLQFVVQAMGPNIHPERWTVSANLPPGLTPSDSRNSFTESITGIPTRAGSYTFTTIVWAHADLMGPSVRKNFTIVITNPTTPPPGANPPPPLPITDPADPAPVITGQPLSSARVARSRVTLRVESSDPDATYQWYRGRSGVTKNPIRNAKFDTFTTPPLKLTSSFWVRVTNGSGSTNSATAVITVTKKRKSANP